jgi:hypothetical protein
MVYVREPLLLTADFTSRIPKRSCALSETVPPTVALRSAS